MTTPNRTLSVANTFGALGYISIVFQWLWSLLLLCYPLIIASPDFLRPSGPATPPQPIDMPSEISPIATTLAIAATLAVLSATVIVIARLPRALGKKAAVLTAATANAVIPAITRHKKITKKQRRKLSFEIILLLKVCLLGIPFILLLFMPHDGPITAMVAWAVAAFCAFATFTYFLLQHLVALFAKQQLDKLW